MATDRSSQLFIDPRTGERTDVVEIHDEVEELTRTNPMPPEVQSAFEANRLIQDKDGSFRKRTSFGEIAAGVVFRKNIRGFMKHTAIAWYAVAPQRLGSALNIHVFLTSSNQAVFGPEALVHYYGGGDATFYVYDWVNHAAAATIPFASWGDHELKVRIAGSDHTALFIINSTFFDAGTTKWFNQVFLANRKTGKFDSIWKSAPFNGFPVPDPNLNREWGPIIEPKSVAGFGTTNRLGYSAARLISDRVNTLLDTTNSDMVEDKRYQFNIVHQVTNHEMLAE